MEKLKMSEQFAILEAHGLKWHGVQAEHDVIITEITSETLDPESEDGKRLIESGWFVSEEYDDCWSKFV